MHKKQECWPKAPIFLANIFHVRAPAIWNFQKFSLAVAPYVNNAEGILS